MGAGCKLPAAFSLSCSFEDKDAGARVPILRTPEYISLHGKGDLACVIQLRIFRGEEFSGSSRWVLRVITRALTRDSGRRGVREDVTEQRSGRRERAVPLAQMEGGVKPKMHVDPRSWKRQGHEVSPPVLEGMQPHQYLGFKLLTSRS